MIRHWQTIKIKTVHVFTDEHVVAGAVYQLVSVLQWCTWNRCVLQWLEHSLHRGEYIDYNTLSHKSRQKTCRTNYPIKSRVRKHVTQITQ